jgi:hypothetical protein
MAAHCDVQGSEQPKQTLLTSGKLMTQQKSYKYHTAWLSLAALHVLSSWHCPLPTWYVIAALKLNDASLPPDL